MMKKQNRITGVLLAAMLSLNAAACANAAEPESIFVKTISKDRTEFLSASDPGEYGLEGGEYGLEDGEYSFNGSEYYHDFDTGVDYYWDPDAGAYLEAQNYSEEYYCNSDTDQEYYQDPVSGTAVQTAILYADFSMGSESPRPEQIVAYDMEYTGELTPVMLAEGLSELTGLDFFADITMDDQGIWVDWANDSTLVAGLDEREQKEEFFFYDNDSLSWFMMDSLWRTLNGAFGMDIYYTQGLGGYLVFEELAPVDTFPNDIPYMGSAFYFAHSGVDNEETVDEYPVNELVFTNGANFTNSKPIETENNADGTYRYRDTTEDGLTMIVNTAFPNSMTDAESMEAYLERVITELGDGSENGFTFEEMTDQAARFTSSCYRIGWFGGSNEDTVRCIGLAVLTDLYTYCYYFQTPADYFSEMEEVCDEILENLELARLTVPAATYFN